MAAIKSFMDWFFNPPTEIEKARKANPHKPVEARGPVSEVFAVMVADLDGPEGVSVTSRLFDSVSRIRGARVSRTHKTIALNKNKGTIEALVEAADAGRDVLYQGTADVLVWGEVDGTGRQIILRFLPLNMAPDGTTGAFSMGDQLIIPVRYAPEMEDVISACAMVAGGCHRTGSKQAVLGLLDEYQSRIYLNEESLTTGLESTQLVSVLTALANISATDTKQDKDRAEALKKAIDFYDKAIEIFPRSMEGPRQALIYNALATTLQALAVEETNTELLERAVTTLKAALAVIQKSRHSQDWALTQMRIGLAIYKLAMRSGRSKMMMEAIAALEQSLTVFSKASSPGKWAEIKNHIGVMMSAMGEEMTGTSMLERSIAVFYECLEVRKRDMVPLLWAQTTNNMGAAAFSLAKRNSNAALMQTAIDAFSGAMEVYRLEGQDRRVHVIDKNLERAQQALSGLA